jgi:hypothetical protein
MDLHKWPSTCSKQYCSINWNISFLLPALTKPHLEAPILNSDLNFALVVLSFITGSAGRNLRLTILKIPESPFDEHQLT